MSHRARTSFAAGEVLSDDDPLLQGRDRLFGPVEQATAGPGELRTLAYECEVCGKVAASRAGLGAHRRVHRSD